MLSSASSGSSEVCARNPVEGSKVDRRPLPLAACHTLLLHLQICLHFPRLANMIALSNNCKYFKNFPRLANILDAFKNLWICFTYLLDLQAQSSTTLNFFAYCLWDLELDSWIGRTLDCLNRAGVWWRINPVSVFVVYQYCICPPLAPIWTHLMGCGPRYNVLRL